MKLPFLRARNATAIVNDVVPAVPVKCTVIVPTSEGNIGIYLSNQEICGQYASTRDFCSLPSTFRNAWSHTCPPLASPHDLAIASPPTPTLIENIWSKLFDPWQATNVTRAAVLKNPYTALQIWEATAGFMIAFGSVVMVCLGVMLCCQSCCSCLRTRRAAPQMRRPNYPPNAG
ncbi:hypothetical protein F5B19DRAFT_489322 [Rostrohypoxylon terebratum]|nr:hypothetical protein F5B19DRAFT_489322 [Rostrohypoxylon terebratum]